MVDIELLDSPNSPRARRLGRGAGLGADDRAAQAVPRTSRPRSLDRLPHERVPAEVTCADLAPARRLGGRTDSRARPRADRGRGRQPGLPARAVASPTRSTGSTCRSPAGEFVAIVGPQRLRQEHASQDHGRPDGAHAAACASRPQVERPLDRSRDRVPEPGAARLAQRARQRARPGRDARARKPRATRRARSSSCTRSGWAGSRPHAARALGRHAPARLHRRALIHDPPLLMMDEPFGALDALTREQMRIDLEQLWLDGARPTSSSPTASRRPSPCLTG